MLKTFGYLLCLLGIYSLLYAADAQSLVTCLSMIAAGVWMVFRRRKVYTRS